MTTKPLTTAIATSDATSITVRGLDLVDEIMGRRTFTEMLYFHVAGRFPDAAETTLVDACLVTIMEHGITPSALISRLVIDSLPGELQVAVGAGLNAVGNVFVGTMEGCGEILKAGVAEKDLDAYCEGVVADHVAAGRRVPGFGHPFHKPDDPRTPKLFSIAASVARDGRYCDVLRRLNGAVDRAYGKHLTINATGAVAALLLEAGLAPDIFRGIAVVSRAGGLLAHVQEERADPMSRKIWSLVEEHTKFRSTR